MKAIMLTLFNYSHSIIMLSYRHAFHAGNHADVLKHYVLGLVLAHATQKAAPFWYVDTHAGAGLYSLTEGYATQNAEYEQGIAKLMSADNLPASLAEFVRTGLLTESEIVRAMGRVADDDEPEKILPQQRRQRPQTA